MKDDNARARQHFKRVQELRREATECPPRGRRRRTLICRGPHMETLPWITVVSGLPRSGTSLMMQTLVAGGIPPLTDDQRAADASNPRGYLELEAVKRLKADRSWLPQARGKAVKIIHCCCRNSSPRLTPGPGKPTA